MLIVCGSATSWMVGNLIDSHGGLHNRITHEIYLAPFTLAETEEMLLANGFAWHRLSILQAYCIMGGTPYYLGLLEKDKSLEANIDRLFFAERGELKREYNRLYSSLFKNSEIYMNVIETLASCKQGLTRKQISEKIKSETAYPTYHPLPRHALQWVSVSTKAYCTVQINCLPLPRFLIKGNNDNSRRTL